MAYALKPNLSQGMASTKSSDRSAIIPPSLAEISSLLTLPK